MKKRKLNKIWIGTGSGAVAFGGLIIKGVISGGVDPISMTIFGIAFLLMGASLFYAAYAAATPHLSTETL